MALCITLFSLLDDVDSETDLAYQIIGFKSIDSLVVTVISIVIAFLVLAALFNVYQALSTETVHILRLVRSKEVPELNLKPDLQYHLFLSHIWSSGQVLSCGKYCGVTVHRFTALLVLVAAFCICRIKWPTSSASCSSSCLE